MESDGPDLNGHAPLNLNGIPSHSSSAGGNENGRRKILEPKRERGHTTRENGAAGAHRTSRKRKESPNDIDPISLEELGGPSTPPAGPLGNPAQQREREEADMSWNSQSDYVAVYMTYVLGIGNVIHFPQLCYRHGGGKLRCVPSRALPSHGLPSYTMAKFGCPFGEHCRDCHIGRGGIISFQSLEFRGKQ